ncbi:MAG: FliH/SctL family protein [Clostridia bacterium]|nr:FliH/SctL family protein [Clostridia bacterium]
MYNNNSYGYGVYKRNQVNIGNPYQVKASETQSHQHLEAFDETAAASADFDQELRISQDIVHKAKEDAALIRREAELEAERIMEEARQKAEALFHETEQKAKEEGYRHGETLAQQHYNDLIEEAQDFKARSKSEYDAMLASLEEEILNLVLNVAAKVVGDEIRNNSGAILGVIRQTIHSCSNHENVVLKVSAEDYDFVVENEEKLRGMISDLSSLEIKKDGTLAKGSCIIDTGFGSADGSVDTRMEMIREAFFEIIQNVEAD